jgi:hypothetical protein
MSNRILELFTISTSKANVDWQQAVKQQFCGYLEKKCVKVRKSQPEISIVTCSALLGVSEERSAIICPHRFLERSQIFIDCLHLLRSHEPGNELHKVPEVAIPGGSVDYFLVSAKNGKVADFVGIELQAVDTTGTTWPARQRFLKSVGVKISRKDEQSKPYGINWKMTAKTTLVQLHHKAETFQHINKHLVLVLQDCLFDYMNGSFRFSHIEDAKLGDPMHFHIYAQESGRAEPRLKLISRKSTDAEGIALSLGLQAKQKVELEVIVAALQAKMSDRTLLKI